MLGIDSESTVWVGLDHDVLETGSPVIFETLIFSDDEVLDGMMERYSTLEDAKEGHERMVEKARSERSD